MTSLACQSCRLLIPEAYVAQCANVGITPRHCKSCHWWVKKGFEPPRAVPPSTSPSPTSHAQA